MFDANKLREGYIISQCRIDRILSEYFELANLLIRHRSARINTKDNFCWEHSDFVGNSGSPSLDLKRKFFRMKFVKFTGKHLCRSIFLNKVPGCFPKSFTQPLRTPFLQNTS